MDFTPTTFDVETQSQNIQILKTVIPYMDGNNQKNFAFMVKFLEMQHVMTLFENNSSVCMCSSNDPSETTMMLLNDLRKFISPQEQDNMDMMMNALQMFSSNNLFSSPVEF